VRIAKYRRRYGDGGLGRVYTKNAAAKKIKRYGAKRRVAFAEISSISPIPGV